MSESENNPFYCSFVGVQYLVCECGEVFQNEESLRIHLQQKHPNRQKINVRHLKKVPPPITEYKCGECGQVYATEAECVTHQEIDHIPFMEELVYQEEDQEDAEEEIIPEIVIPATSDGTQSSPPHRTPDEHSLRVQSLPGGGRRAVPSERKPRERKLKKRKPYQHKNVICETCGKKYASKAAMRYHQRVHTGVRPYKCMYCPKTFTMALFLQVHVRTHTGERPYRCPLCPKAFGNRAALLRHDRVHTGIKPYQCPSCGKCFTQSNSLKLHFHTVHLKMPTPYKSKRRRAESDARDKKTRTSLGDRETEAQAQPALGPAPRKVYYEIKTPAGRKITLSSLMPRKVQEQQPVYNVKEEEDEEQEEEEAPPDAREGEGEGEVYYYSVKPEAIEEGDVAYEIIYE